MIIDIKPIVKPEKDDGEEVREPKVPEKPARAGRSQGLPLEGKVAVGNLPRAD